ncbi:MAG: hypothetical protein U0Q11_16920 [Vicinamibacterales bacterium]|mgnify:CR=1 FL=1
MIVVTIDSDRDDETAVCLEHREDEVYPDLTDDGATLRAFGSTKAVRAQVAQALADPSVSFISGSGHGLERQFTGQDGSAILGVGTYSPAEVRNKIVHLLACHTAVELGPDIVRNGCQAFFGYDVAFLLPANPADLALFLDCDAEIDRALVEGETAEAAYDRAYDAYTAAIFSLFRAGKPHLAATLQQLRDHLCAPSVDARYGRTDARLPR